MLTDGLGATGGGAQGAVDWAFTQLHSQVYDGWCARFVAFAFNSSDFGYDTAWEGAQAMGLHPGAAPAGALVFFRPDPTNEEDGHVGIALPGNQMISAESNGVQVTSLAIAYWQKLYAGWAPAPAKWPGRPPTGAGPQLEPTTPVPTPTPTPAPTSPTSPSSGATGSSSPSAATVTDYDCPSTSESFGHYVPSGTHWGNDFIAQGNTITGGHLLIGANEDGGNHQASIGIFTEGPDTLSGELGSTTLTVSGYSGVNFTFSPAIKVTSGESLWLVASGIGNFTAYDQNNGGADGCFIGSLTGSSE